MRRRGGGGGRRARKEDGFRPLSKSAVRVFIRCISETWSWGGVTHYLTHTHRPGPKKLHRCTERHSSDTLNVFSRPAAKQTVTKELLVFPCHRDCLLLFCIFSRTAAHYDKSCGLRRAKVGLTLLPALCVEV